MTTTKRVRLVGHNLKNMQLGCSYTLREIFEGRTNIVLNKVSALSNALATRGFTDITFKLMCFDYETLELVIEANCQFSVNKEYGDINNPNSYKVLD